jgi:hypothetical protein
MSDNPEQLITEAKMRLAVNQEGLLFLIENSNLGKTDVVDLRYVAIIFPVGISPLGFLSNSLLCSMNSEISEFPENNITLSLRLGLFIKR